MLRLAADVIVVLHGVLIVFVVFGGLLVVRWPRSVWVHLPAAVWGVVVELMGWVCPLTPIENYLRERSGLSAYRGDFVEHYLVPLIYPARLTRAWQLLLGAAAVVVNVLVYRHVIRTASHKDTR